MRAGQSFDHGDPLVQEKGRLLGLVESDPSPALVSDLSKLASRFRDIADFSSSLECLEKSMTVLQRFTGAEHAAVARLLISIGALNWDLGRVEKALSHYEVAHDMLVRCEPDDEANIATCRHNLGEALTELGRLEEARPHHEHSVKYFTTVHGPDHPLTLQALRELRRLEEKEREAGRGA